MTIPLNNWGSSPVIVKKGLHIGVFEEVTIVDKEDETWSDQPSGMVCMCQPSDVPASRLQNLCSQLQIGEACNKVGKAKIMELLLNYHDVLALSDEELGETDVVTHSIDTGSAPPVKLT